ncbi:HPr family phosphocarrier protein [Mucilaginibacter sp. X5P1]|uniref:HPr family phosphocarrier protein n=1 Tax=Mucilaginibacter sp. X5P1 TaxID=2723088 RepID=UPI0016119EB3|nr:HPr family phosphocarrier protein [Mucilaginibacter sp. X5P1]MBB6136800.1 phosphocarrier protein [Mucilaginibacter sp. X5P1]
MITKEYTITSAQGIHARPATTLIRLTKSYKSTISIKKNNKTVRLNSILNILSMAIKGGETISILIEGDDEIIAADALDHFFNEELKAL